MEQRTDPGAGAAVHEPRRGPGGAVTGWRACHRASRELAREHGGEPRRLAPEDLAA